MIWKTENYLSCSNYNKVPFIPTLAHKSPRVIFLIKFTLDNFVIVLFELAFEYHLGVGLGFGGSKKFRAFFIPVYRKRSRSQNTRLFSTPVPYPYQLQRAARVTWSTFPCRPIWWFAIWNRQSSTQAASILICLRFDLNSFHVVVSNEL